MSSTNKQSIALRSTHLPSTLRPNIIIREQPQVDVALEIAGLLNRLARLYQIPNWDETNTILLTEWVIEAYPAEEMETIRKALTRPFSSGKTWRLTPDTLTEWIGAEIEKQAIERERQAHNFKASEIQKELPEEILKVWKENIDKIPDVKKYSMSDEDVKKEGSEKVNDRTYIRPTDEQVIMNQLHIQWIRENYDSLTGKPKANWTSEEEWLKMDR